MLDQPTAALIRHLQDRPDVIDLLNPGEPHPPAAPVVDVQFAIEATVVSFFSVVSTIGTPGDITAQELRLEAFFPSHDASRVAWSDFAGPTLSASSTRR